VNGERELAQSGRPRRAKRPRGSSHGGKTVRSTPACEGIRKDVAVAGHRAMEGASDRRSRSFFTRGRGKRSRPISVVSSRKRGHEASSRNRGRVKVGDGGVRGGLLEGYHGGGEHPLQGARAGRRSVRGAVKARHTPKPRAQARSGSVTERYAGALRSRVFWQLLVVRISGGSSSITARGWNRSSSHEGTRSRR